METGRKAQMKKTTRSEIMRRRKKDGKDPMVSICCITYNHEAYIADAIESFLSQETDFAFEIVIDDDSSTDETVNIVKAYVQAYPDIIRANFVEKNRGPSANFLANMQRARGTYIALCEGDDYWVDPHKLQKQYEALRRNPECAMACHDAYIVDRDKTILRKHSRGRANEAWKSGVYPAREIVGAPLTIPHTSSVFFPRSLLDTDFFRDVEPADYPLFVSLCRHGAVYYDATPMSVYRQNPTGLSRTRIGERKTLLERIETNHRAMIDLLDGTFAEEITTNLKGHRMMYREAAMRQAIRSGSYGVALYHFVWMLRHCKGTQYGYRDILWLARSGIVDALKG